MIYLLKRITLLLFFLILVVTASVFWGQIWSPSKFSLIDGKIASVPVQKLSRLILTEKLFGYIGNPPSGDDGWYKVFISQESHIRKLELQDRLDFYAIMLLNVDFDAESIDSFTQLVKSDASDLTKSLSVFEQGHHFSSLNNEQQLKIKQWKMNSEFIAKTGKT